jgi:hypothetical protein
MKRVLIISALLAIIYLPFVIDETVGVSFKSPVETKDLVHHEEVVVRPEMIEEIQYIHIDRGTRYNPTPGQCDDTPFHTADGSFIDVDKLKKGEVRWVALSWDLINDPYRQRVRNEDWAWKGEFSLGDTIYVESESSPSINGSWVVHDVMNGRYRKSIDFLYHEDNMDSTLGVCEDIKIKLKSN